MNYYNNILSIINTHLNDLKKEYTLSENETNKLQYDKIIAHNLSLIQQTKGINYLFDYLIKNNPCHIITQFEDTDYPNEYKTSIICIYINEFYVEHTNLINKLIQLNQYHLLKYKTNWKYFDTENEKFLDIFYGIINKIEHIKNQTEYQNLISEIEHI